MMEAATAAQLLRDRLLGAGRREADLSDLRALASVLALASLEETDPGQAAGCGLAEAELEALLSREFPALDPSIAAWLLRGASRGQGGADEEALAAFLFRLSSARASEERLFARLLARRARRPGHLWQEMGFSSRAELGALMERRFAPLVRRNVAGMRWKKFFSRALCLESEQLSCPSPVCDDCPERRDCFGSEAGASLVEGSGVLQHDGT